ncbi:MAG: hypothetical protein RL732_327, partial [Bacteroidota bacterium]
EGYFLSNRQMPWWIVLVSIMGTQASAVTFLTAPGQAYTDGMRFLQYYFGLPVAMVLLCITLVPLFHRLKVFTAYAYLEQRFDLKTRTLTAFLFLLSRGLSTGISVIAPSLVLHSLLGWDFYLTNLAMGGLLIVYTTTGGARAVAYTQQLQFIIIYSAMGIAAFYAVKSLPPEISVIDALHVGGKSGKLNVITSGVTASGFDWKDKYNLFSGLIGGFFLALSYFGTDQSQVGRYLTARSVGESKRGLLMNGLVKVPLQFFILIIGVFIFVLYPFHRTPAYFNLEQEKQVRQTVWAPEYAKLETTFQGLQDQRKNISIQLALAIKANDEARVDQLRHSLQEVEAASRQVRTEIKQVIKKAIPDADGNDTNYIFLRFAGDFLPKGIVGLLIAILFLASWGSIAAALNGLSSSTMIDFHLKFSRRQLKPEEEYRWSQFYTLVWGLFCVVTSLYAYNVGNSLIEAVNILGSWFYGTILGIFLVAFYFKRVGGHAVFAAALLTELLVIAIYKADVISFLWLNVIGTAGVLLLSNLLQLIIGNKKPGTSPG